MHFRTYKDTDLTVSEVGFGLWTISTGWSANFTKGEAIASMHGPSLETDSLRDLLFVS
jgi:hypothetical protein